MTDLPEQADPLVTSHQGLYGDGRGGIIPGVSIAPTYGREHRHDGRCWCEPDIQDLGTHIVINHHADH